MPRSAFFTRAVLFPVLAALAACSEGGGGSPVEPEAPRPARLILSASEIRTVEGDTARVPFTVLDADSVPLRALPAGASVAWTSANPSVAEVDASGTILARAPGRTLVVARLLELADTVEVVVAARPVALNLSPPVLRIEEGDSADVVATALDARGDPVAVLPAGAEVTWASTDTSVATVDARGTVVGHAPGTALVIARLLGIADTVAVEVAAEPVDLEIVGGDAQEAPTGRPLPDSLRVRVVDRRGAGVAGVVVRFAVVDGGGSVEPDSVRTGPDGTARARWVLGAPAGEQVAQATSVGDTVRFRALALAPVAEVRVTPGRDSLQVGERVSLSATAYDGSGGVVSDVEFTWTSSDTAVAVVSSTGSVEARGAGTAAIRARTTNGIIGTATIVVVNPPPSQATCTSASARSLAVGEAVTLAGAEAAALCLGGGAGGAEFVAVPFYASRSGGATLGLEVGGEGVVGVSGPPNPARISAGGMRLPASPDLAWERGLRERERREVGPRMGSARAAGPRLSRASAPVPEVGQLLSFNTAARCAEPLLRVGRVAAVTRRAVIVADTANPSGGFTDAEFRELGLAIDTLVYPVDSLYFGEPTDIDENDRVIVFYTRAVNELTAPGHGSYVGGFFWAGDLLPQSSCPASNHAEMFYMLAPDPEGVLGNVRTKEFVQRTTVGTLAHELQHLINASRRIYVTGATSLEQVWLNEGLSHIAEELLFYATSGLAPRQNITAEVLRSSSRTVDAANRYLVSNLGRFRTFLQNPDTTSLLGQDRLPTRGAVWAFLRYAADREPGSDVDFFRALVNTTATGLDNLAQVLPDAPLQWMQEWTVAVYADDAVPSIPPRFQTLSWNYRSVMPLLSSGSGYPLRVTVLQNAASVTLSLKAGGAAYLRFGVAAGAAAGLRATTGGVAPPPELRLSVLRTR